MEWPWDPEKNDGNRREHRISFEMSRLVFDDPLTGDRPGRMPDVGANHQRQESHRP